LSRLDPEGGSNGVRVLSLLRSILGLAKTVIEAAVLDPLTGDLIVAVRPKKGARSRCGVCQRKCPGYDQGSGQRRWRAPDLGHLRVFLEAAAPRVRCPAHGVLAAWVPWARHRAWHTRDFEDWVAFLTRGTAKTTVATMMRITWRTVGHILTRFVAEADATAGDRLAGLRRIGIDEIAYRRGHKYLWVIVDHDTGRLLWVNDGRTKASLNQFFDLLGEDRCHDLELVSADGADLIAEVVALRAPNAQRCMDPFHVVVWATTAVDEVRRRVAAEARAQGHTVQAKAVAGSKWVMLRGRDKHTPRQQARFATVVQTNQPLFEAVILYEQLRGVFAAGGPERGQLLDTWIADAAASDLAPFQRLAERIEDYAPTIKNALAHKLSNARTEAINNKIRLLTRIAYGFKRPSALMSLIMLHYGGYPIRIPGRIPI
jgi:transposase